MASSFFFDSILTADYRKHNKTRLAFGLANILKYDINNLMTDVEELYLDKARKS